MLYTLREGKVDMLGLCEYLIETQISVIIKNINPKFGITIAVHHKLVKII